jgi:glycosyltransferase involved in cell wall biosynthesis
VVLHVLEAVESGTARHVVDLVRHVEGVRHHVAVPRERQRGNTDHSALTAMGEAGATLHVVEMRRWVLAADNLVAPLRLAHLIRRIRPQIVHGHSSIGGVVARIGALGSGAARVYTPHLIAPGRAPRAVERSLGRLTDCLVAVSPSEQASIEQLAIVPPDRIRLIRNGVDLDPPPPSELDLRSHLGLPAGTPLIASIGRLFWQKAPDDFVRVCAEVATAHPEAAFLYVGNGPDQPLVEAAVAAAGPGLRWYQLPYLPEAARLLPQLDVFVMTSRAEGGPYAPLEAMRAGVPVVLTDCSGCRDTVIDGESGFLRPVGDIVGLAGAVSLLLEKPELSAAVAGAARARLASVFDVDEQARRTAELYRDLTHPPGGVRRHHAARSAR